MQPWSVQWFAMIGVLVAVLAVIWGIDIRRGYRQALRQPNSMAPGTALLGGIILALLVGALIFGVYSFVFHNPVAGRIMGVIFGLSPLLNAVGFEFGYARARRSRAAEAHPDGESGQPVTS